MNSDTNTNNNMSNVSSTNNNKYNININGNNKLTSLYDHELGSILHNDSIFETNDALLNNVHNDVPISKIQVINSATETNNNNNNNNSTTAGVYNQQDTINLVDISNSANNESSKVNSDSNNISQSVNQKNNISRSNSNSVITDNASSGTIEDIINPAFMKPTVLNNSNSNNRRGTLMLARDAKADIRNIMRMGSPLGIFNNEHISSNDLNDFYDNKRRSNNSNHNANDNTNASTGRINRNTAPLYSADIIKNSIISSNNNFSNTTNTTSNNKNFINTSNNHIPQNAPTHRRHNQHKTRPAFINKLWNMVNDDNNKDLIQWADDGKSFIVKNREVFVHEILPRYFKHSNFASFVRQLNMYGWHKVQDIRSGSIQGSSDDKWQFANENFIRGREDLLVHIVRQRGSPHNHNHTQPQYNNNTMNNNVNNSSNHNSFVDGNLNSIQVNGNAYPNYNINQKLLQTIQNDQTNSNSSDLLRGNSFQLPNNLNSHATLHITNGPDSIPLQNSISTVLNELEQIKYNQIAISKDLLRINKDNELLWKENMIARERYRSQQQILEKIFRFMAAMMPLLDQKKIMDGLTDKDKGSNNVTTTTNNSNNGMNVNPNDVNNNVNNTNRNNISNVNNTFNEFRSSNLNISDPTNSVVNGMVNYGRNSEPSPQIITPSESESRHNAVYLESLEDIDNSPSEPISSNRNIINRKHNDNNGKRDDRLLLEKKVTYSNSNDINSNENFALMGQQYNTIYSNTMPNIYSNNDINHSSNRISEIPFEDGGADSNIPIIQEINSNTTSPRAETRNENTANISVVNGKNTGSNNNAIFARLQDNIEEQDNRIRHLEDMVTHLTPKLMSPMPMLDSHDLQYNPASNSQNISNTNNFRNSVRSPQDYYVSENNDPITSNFNQNNTGSNKADSFDLQDYLTHESPSHQETNEDTDLLPVQPPTLSGMSPLMMEDSPFLLNGEDSTHINPIFEVDQKIPQPPQIEELSTIKIPHTKRTHATSSVSNSGKLKKQKH